MPESQRTLNHIVRAGAQVATRHGADAHTLLDTLKKVVARLQPRLPQWLQVEWRRVFDRVPWIPPRKRLLYGEMYQYFPDAPWGLARKIKLPRLVVELPRWRWGKPKPFQRKWGRIHWKRDLIFGELRVQQRILFPKAPRWSAVHGVSVKSLRLTTHKSKPLTSAKDRERDLPRDISQSQKGNHQAQRQSNRPRHQVGDQGHDQGLWR